ncbi:DeoR/GlpR family DNA-binding transcription regulator [Spiroplasma poulsonii]|nr:DeoR/GlpR family DNA-binding transcription regulator [Spiroplasma poulsonii]
MMLKEQRWEKILACLDEQHLVLVNDLITKLQLSPTTLCRDLTEMEQQGLLKRVHGGVKLQKVREFRLEEQLNEKIQHHAEAKYLIAQQAVKKIKPKMWLYLDAGSSTLALIKLMRPDDDLVIITNSIFHVKLLALAGFNNVYVLGGKYKHQTGALIGWEAVSTLQKYHLDCAFLGVNGISGANLYTTDPEKAMIKAEVIKCVSKSYVLADKSKFNAKSSVKFASQSEVEIITN